MFSSNAWEENMGREQTAYFANEAIQRLPENVRSVLDEGGTLLDYACALGDAANAFRQKFPAARITGYEWASVGRDKAAAAYPDLEFICELPTERMFDVVYCSNMLEHIDLFRDEMIRQTGFVSKFYVVLVPWEETYPLVPSHVHSFNTSNFPPALPDFVCVHYQEFPTNTYWWGKQYLVIYERN